MASRAGSLCPVFAIWMQGDTLFSQMQRVLALRVRRTWTRTAHSWGHCAFLNQLNPQPGAGSPCRGRWGPGMCPQVNTPGQRHLVAAAESSGNSGFVENLTKRHPSSQKTPLCRVSHTVCGSPGSWARSPLTVVLGENSSTCYVRLLGEKGQLVEWCAGALVPHTPCQGE